MISVHGLIVYILFFFGVCSVCGVISVTIVLVITVCVEFPVHIAIVFTVFVVYIVDVGFFSVCSESILIYYYSCFNFGNVFLVISSSSNFQCSKYLACFSAYMQWFRSLYIVFNLCDFSVYCLVIQCCSAWNNVEDGFARRESPCMYMHWC